MRLGEGQTNQQRLTNSATYKESSRDQEGEKGATTDEPPDTPTLGVNANSTPLAAESSESRSEVDQRQGKKGGVPLTPTNEDSTGALSTPTGIDGKVAENSAKDTPSFVKGLGKKQQRKTFKEKPSLHKKYGIPDDTAKVESDDNDSSMEVHTSSS